MASNDLGPLLITSVGNPFPECAEVGLCDQQQAAGVVGIISDTRLYKIAAFVLGALSLSFCVGSLT